MVRALLSLPLMPVESSKTTMRKLFTMCSMAVLSAGLTAQNCADVFISEYVEGSGNNKALELYNPTNDPIDLGDYRLIRYDNGSDFGSELVTPDKVLDFPAGFTVAAKDVVVFALNLTNPAGTGQDQPIDPALQAKTDTLFCAGCNPQTADCRAMCFNGDDALCLQKTTDGGTTWQNVDIFASVGERPSNNQGSYSPTAGWTSIAPYSSMPVNYDSNVDGPYFLQYWTQNQTLVRKPSVTQGVTVNPAPQTFNPSVEWDSIPEDTFDSLGTHTCDCNTLSLEDAPEAYTQMAPNPAKDMVNLRSEMPMVALRLRSLNGALIRELSLNQVTELSFSVADLASGAYVVELEWANGKMAAKKLLRQ